MACEVCRFVCVAGAATTAQKTQKLLLLIVVHAPDGWSIDSLIAATTQAVESQDCKIQFSHVYFGIGETSLVICATTSAAEAEMEIQ